MQDFAQFFKDGGNLMYLNLAVAVFAAAVICERLYMLGIRYRMADKQFVLQVEKFVMAGNIDRALKLCSQYAEKLQARVARAGLANARMGGGAVTAAIEEAMTEVMPLVTKRVGLLWGIANVATLVGLIGTIFGLIDAFAAQALASPEQKSALLTAGIAHAMNNTAFGLAIAVACIVFHMVISNLTKGLVESLEYGAVRIENMVARRLVRGGAEPAAPAAGTGAGPAGA